MSHLINTRASLVADAIEGELRAAGGRLVRLNGFPDIRVVLRRDRDPNKVAIVSGGGAGHEPAHAGFVGRGMLTAAVSGDVFASPSTDAVLSAIMAVGGPAGVLLVVKNYTGDRLNFGLAAERARAAGIRVETVIVGDDIALPDLAQPRGIAGTLFVHKIAGALAEAGETLERVSAAARAAAADARSIGMALSTCTVPGQDNESRLAPGEAELGLGIHGEPGAERGAVASASDTVAIMLDRLGVAGGDETLAVLVNNLGGLPPLELAVVTDCVLRSLGARAALLLGPAPMMTSLDMKGFSLSILPLDAERRAALLAPTEARGWPSASVPSSPETVPLPTLPEAGGMAASSGPATGDGAGAMLTHVFAALIAQEETLNRLDARVGDGDTGSTVARAAATLSGEMERLVQPLWGETLLAIGQTAGKAMGGSSGVVASIFLSAAGSALGSGSAWPSALATGLERVSFHGGAAEGDRTALDALAPAIRVLEQGGSIVEAARAAQAGADRTAEIVQTKSGRSSYLRADDLRGVADPGAVAVAAIFTSLAQLHRA